MNAAAAILLAGGFFLLYSMHGKEEIQIRAGKQVYNAAERALIDEIRKETSMQIEAKENEISLIVSKMENIDTQLQDLHSSNLELTAEQIAAEENLKRLQDEYRLSLSALQDDRSRILENARAREASLAAQLDERTRQIGEISERSEAALNEARSALEKLSSEQEKSAAVESQLGAYFETAGRHIREGRLDDARDTLTAARLFLDTPSFQGLRSIQARKELYGGAITALEAMAEETRKNRAALAAAGSGESAQALEELAAKNAALEETVAGLNRSIAAAASQGSDAAQRFTELEHSVSALQTLKTALETSVTEKEKSIADLTSQNTGLTQTVAAQETAISALEDEKASLDSQLTSLRQALQALSQ